MIKQFKVCADYLGTPCTYKFTAYYTLWKDSILTKVLSSFFTHTATTSIQEFRSRKLRCAAASTRSLFLLPQEKNDGSILRRKYVIYIGAIAEFIY